TDSSRACEEILPRRLAKNYTPASAGVPASDARQGISANDDYNATGAWAFLRSVSKPRGGGAISKRNARSLSSAPLRGEPPSIPGSSRLHLWRNEQMPPALPAGRFNRRIPNGSHAPGAVPAYKRSFPNRIGRSRTRSGKRLDAV